MLKNIENAIESLQIMHTFSDQEQSIILSLAWGTLEAKLYQPYPSKPADERPRIMTFLAHPHSLMGGTMDNKVVTTLARVLRQRGMPYMRFNARGVGQSEGVFDGGMGESDDLMAMVATWRQAHPLDQIILAGFSFGSFVVYRAAQVVSPIRLVLVAPAVNHFDYAEALKVPNTHVIHGIQDEIVPWDCVRTWSMQEADRKVHTLPEATHFFHGQLNALAAIFEGILD